MNHSTHRLKIFQYLKWELEFEEALLLTIITKNRCITATLKLLFTLILTLTLIFVSIQVYLFCVLFTLSIAMY